MKETEEIKVDIDKIDDKEMGVGKDYKIKLASMERMKAVDGAYVLKMRLEHNRLSMRANQTFGNLDAAKEFEASIVAVKMRLSHSLIVVKAIDKEYPEAKSKMIEMYHTEEEDVTKN